MIKSKFYPPENRKSIFHILMLKSTDQIRGYWNEYSKTYQLQLEPVYFQAALCLSTMLKIQEKKNIIEVGCGPGLLSVYLLAKLPSDCKYTSIDIAEDMLEIARKRKEEKKHQLNDVDHSFVRGDAENLDFIPDESADVYLGSLVLHLNANPHKLIQEAKRVLKKGCCLGFTVLGKLENNSIFKIVHDAFDKNGIDLPHKSSGGLPLNDRESLIQITQENGLEVVYAWKEILTFDVFEEKGFIKVLGQPRIAKIMNELDPETKAKVERDMKNTLDQTKSQHLPLQAEVLFIIAKKPS